jgi:hypothetical protein
LERGDGGRAAGVSLWQEPIENYAISVLRVTTLLVRRQSHFGGNKPTDIGDDFTVQPLYSALAPEARITLPQPD